MICLGKKGYVVVVRGIYAQTDGKEQPNASNPDGHFNRVIPQKKKASLRSSILQETWSYRDTDYCAKVAGHLFLSCLWTKKKACELIYTISFNTDALLRQPYSLETGMLPLIGSAK